MFMAPGIVQSKMNSMLGPATSQMKMRKPGGTAIMATDEETFHEELVAMVAEGMSLNREDHGALGAIPCPCSTKSTNSEKYEGWGSRLSYIYESIA